MAEEEKKDLKEDDNIMDKNTKSDENEINEQNTLSTDNLGDEEAASDENVEDSTEEAASDENVEDTAKNDKSGRKSIFSRKDKDKKDTKIDELNDKFVRLMAEYDNYRKRTDKEKSMMYDMGAKSIIEKVLPVLDNFERGFDCIDDTSREDPFVQGMDKTYKQMLSMLEEAGVKAIDAVGKEFDPNIHNAVMHIDDETLDTNVVAEEFQKGYMYRDAVIRCSMVKVAN